MWPFDRLRHRETSTPIIPFRSGSDFLKFQCKYGLTALREGQGVVALVLDPVREFGPAIAERISPSASPMLLLKVAAPDGGFLVMSEPPAAGDPINPDDVVIWVPMQHDSELGRALKDDRSGWVGFVGAKVAPEIDAASAQFRILYRYA